MPCFFRRHVGSNNFESDDGHRPSNLARRRPQAQQSWKSILWSQGRQSSATSLNSQVVTIYPEEPVEEEHGDSAGSGYVGGSGYNHDVCGYAGARRGHQSDPAGSHHDPGCPGTASDFIGCAAGAGVDNAAEGRRKGGGIPERRVAAGPGRTRRDARFKSFYSYPFIVIEDI